MGKGGHLEASGQGGGYHTAKWQPRGGQNRTAAPHPPRWSSWDRGAVEEFEGNGKWGALGEIRRVAVECNLGYVNVRGIKGHALTIAQGPDGTRGFEVQRTRLDDNETGLEIERTIEQCSTVPSTLFYGYLVLILTLTLGVLLIWLLPSMVAGGATLWVCAWLIKYMQLERFALIVAVMAAGMVLTCLIGDWVLVVAQLILQALKGVEMSVVRLALTCGALTVWGGIVGDEEAVGIVFVLSCRGKKNHLGQVVDVNFAWSSAPSTGRVSLTDPSHAEAGRLRRKAAAELFFKVFDPGGSTVSAAAAAAAAAAVAATAAAAGNSKQQQQRQQQRQHVCSSSGS